MDVESRGALGQTLLQKVHFPFRPTPNKFLISLETKVDSSAKFTDDLFLVVDHFKKKLCPTGLGGVVVIDAAIGVHGRGSRLAHYFTVAATLDKSLTSHCL